jgi:hypothetical protein
MKEDRASSSACASVNPAVFIEVVYSQTIRVVVVSDVLKSLEIEHISMRYLSSGRWPPLAIYKKTGM